MRMKMLAVLAVASGLGLSACGSSHGEGHGGSASSGESVDRAFVAEMIPHHESAIEMAEIAQERGTSPFVKSLADDIIRTQSSEIDTLRTEDAQLAEEGAEKGDLGVPGHMMGMDGDTASLRSADPFDQAFLNMMIPHHEGAVTMAEVELDKGSDPELKRLAEQIVAAQEREITQMKAELGSDLEASGGHSG